MTKYKMTGCARFFLVILILAPLAYIGASLYNGQDPVENIRSIFGGTSGDDINNAYNPADNEGDQQSAPSEPREEEANGYSADDFEELRQTIEQLEENNEELKSENKSLEQRIDALEKEIERIKVDSSGQ